MSAIESQAQQGEEPEDDPVDDVDEEVVAKGVSQTNVLEEDDSRILAAQATDPAILTQGLLNLFVPVVQKIDGHVIATRESQAGLKEQIERMQTEMSKFDALPNVADDLDFYLRKLAAAKRKLQTANNFLEASQDRVNKLKSNIAKAAKKKQKELEGTKAPKSS